MSADFLRHTLATLAYRASKPLRDAPSSFAHFRAAPDSRTPGEIVAHLGDLMTWATFVARGEHQWKVSAAGDWTADVERFYSELARLDALLGQIEPSPQDAERVFQGAIADSLTHVGQLTMLRRLAGAPIRGENYARADIVRGRVGLSQAAPRVEFD